MNGKLSGIMIIMYLIGENFQFGNFKQHSWEHFWGNDNFHVYCWDRDTTARMIDDQVGFSMCLLQRGDSMNWKTVSTPLRNTGSW
jgi:hypothetical protein